MIHEIKRFCQIIENSSNKHFSFNRFEYTFCHSEGSIFNWYPFPKTVPFCDQYVVSFHVLAEATVHGFLEYLRKNINIEVGL